MLKLSLIHILFIHGVVPANQKLHHGDTLDADWPTDEETDFNMVLMNPPYSAKWSAAKGFLQDERFSDYGVLAPKSKADYAFLLHGLYHLKNNGTMAVSYTHLDVYKRQDLETVTNVDLRNVNIASIAAIFVIILIVFKSISLPVILVAVIEFAICVNMAVPYYTGLSLPFVASIVIGTIQLGATVDYAILMTSRYQKAVSYTHLEVYKRQCLWCSCSS